MRERLLGFAVALGLVAAWVLPCPAADAVATKPVDYLREVRPILSARCYTCHGPDEKERKEDLRLDVREDAIKSAIVPGNAAKSSFIERIATTDPEMVMPPPKAKKPPLTPQEVETLKRWVNEGAKFEMHWAYRLPVRTEAPPAKEKDWPLNPLDNFLAAGYAKAGLAHAPEADRRTLIRRLYFDLIGLPPSADEVDAFMADKSPEAYEKLVDKLLANEHFGERMALYWLDLVRYADSNGYHGDNPREIWLYRDWVIQAFNSGKPYDQFCIEQLAGDLLPNATREMRIASGYNKLLMTTQEGGAQPKEYTAKYAADRVRNVSAVWLGSTMGCCECHNHKFDPFTARDFYSMAAFFADVKETPVGAPEQTAMPSAEQQARLKEIEDQIAELKSKKSPPTQLPTMDQATWEKSTQGVGTQWTVLKPEKAESVGGATLTVLDDGSILASGTATANDTYTLTVEAPAGNITGFRLEALPHDSLPLKSSGRAVNGNFVLTEFSVHEKQGLKPVKLANATASFEQTIGGEANPYGKWTASGAIDGDAKGAQFGWATLGENTLAIHAVFETEKDLVGGPKKMLLVELRHNYGGNHSLGHFRISATTAARPLAAVGVGAPRPVRDALTVAADKRSPAQQDEIAKYFKTQDLMPAATKAKLAELEKEKAALSKTLPTTLVSLAIAPRMVRVLPRGNYLDDSGDVMSPAVPAFLGALQVKDRRPTRLDLAQWVVSPENPLFARVYVNRLWKVMFGAGVCKSLEDFGAQGSVPTNPELLDWLAVEFRESKFNVKHMLKLMAMTRAYRQSSISTPEQREKDPLNLYLARQNRYRLDAELVRDNALAASGLLVPTVGGPSVKPYQPPGYWSWLNFPAREWANDKGDGLYRRGLYTFWQRTFLHPSLVAFDAPSREECTAERVRSNTPLQALVLLNDPTYVETARALAVKMIREGGGDEASRIKFAFRRVLARQPSADEERVLVALYQKHKQQYAADGAAAAALAEVGDFRAPAEIDKADLAGATSVARTLLNLHETVTRN